MADIKPIMLTHWRVPSFEEFEVANPHLNNHSSRLVLEPEVPVVPQTPNSSSD